eukprot:765937-Hanusia_phi.AAC.2
MARWWRSESREERRHRKTMEQQQQIYHHTSHNIHPSPPLSSPSSPLHPLYSKEDLPQLAGVGLVIGKRQHGYLVKGILDGTGAMLSGMKKGDLVVQVRALISICAEVLFLTNTHQVDDKEVDPLSLEEMTEAILGPVGSIVKLKVMRRVSERHVLLEFLVVRELKATQNPIFHIKCERNKVTRSHLHLQCAQEETLRYIDEDQEEGQDIRVGSDASPPGLTSPEPSPAAAGDPPVASACDEITVEVSSSDEITEITVDPTCCAFLGNNVLVDGGLDVLVLFEEKRTSWRRCRLQLTRAGKLLLPSHSLHGSSVLWAQPHMELYRPDMSKEEFAGMGTRLCLLVEGQQVTAHGRHGAISAVKAERLHVMVRDSSTRDRLNPGLLFLFYSSVAVRQPSSCSVCSWCLPVLSTPSYEPRALGLVPQSFLCTQLLVLLWMVRPLTLVQICRRSECGSEV